MNRREFLKKTGATIAAAGAVGALVGRKLEQTVDALPSVEADPFYAGYLNDVAAGNQEAILAGFQMAKKLQEGVASNTRSLKALEELIQNSSMTKRNAYEMVLLSLDARITQMKLEVRKFADPIDAYYKQNPNAPVPDLPKQEPEPPPLPDEVEKGRMKYS